MTKLQLQIQSAGGGGAFVEVPAEVVEQLGDGRKRLKVQAKFDGVPYRGLLAPYGGRVMLLILKSIREQLHKDVGDVVEVELVLDEEPRVVEVPGVLAKALGKAGLREAFDELSYTNRKEYVAWINGAKTDATRERRLLLAIEKLKAGKRNPSEK
ncbi:MAG: DUF1905 domain-containing protein [Verrucomicrobia bacterium]|nr:DUF1905 domain-containing protein [Verrucomicrobiota bacterium]